jgi:hypothetical protein
MKGRGRTGLKDGAEEAALAKYLPSPRQEGCLRKGLGMANYEGKVAENADVAKWQTQRT